MASAESTSDTLPSRCLRVPFAGSVCPSLRATDHLMIWPSMVTTPSSQVTCSPESHAECYGSALSRLRCLVSGTYKYDLFSIVPRKLIASNNTLDWLINVLIMIN